MQHRLQPRRRHHPYFLQDRAEQAALGRYRQDGGRDHQGTCRCDEGSYGLKTWKNAPADKILKSDVAIAKNYLNEEEIKGLERVVSMYLDYAENQAARRIAMRMTDWVTKLDAFLAFNEYEILKDAGRVSHAVAKTLAEKEYEAFRLEQDRAFESDFERTAKRVTAKAKTRSSRTKKPGTDQA